MNKIRKISILIIFLVVCFSFIKTTNITAAEEIGVYSNLEVSKEEVLSGEYVDLTFSIHNLANISETEDGIALLMLKLYYDSSKYEIPFENIKNNDAIISDTAITLSERSISLGLITSDIICKVILSDPNYISIEILYSLLSVGSLNEDGDIFSLRFTAKEKASGMSQFYMVDNNEGGYSYIFTSKSDIQYSIITTNTYTEVEVISTDASIKEVYVTSLDTNVDYTANYKSGRYEVLVPSGTNQIDIVIETNSSEATVSGGGIKTLINTGGRYILEVIAQDGLTKRNVELSVRAMKSVKTIMEVQLQNGEFTDGTTITKLHSSTSEYTLRVKYSKSLTLTTFVTPGSGAKVYHNDMETPILSLNNLIALEENVEEFNVVAEDGSIRLYTFTIIMEEAADDITLEYIRSDEDSSVTVKDNAYTISYPYSNNNKVRVIVKANNSATVISFAGSLLNFSLLDGEYISDEITLKPGVTSIYNIKATSRNGDSILYVANLYMETLDTRSGLDNIYINDIAIDGFSKKNFTYDLGVFPYTTSSLKVSIDKENPNSTVTGLGDSITLSQGSGVIIITVNSEDALYGETQGVSKYYLTYYREATLSSNNDIESIFVNGQDINFEKTVMKYDLTISYNIKYAYIEVTLAANSKNSTIGGDIGYQTLVVGENNLEITVTSEDGKETQTYQIIVIVSGPSTNTNIEKLLIDDVELELEEGKYYLETDYSVNHIYLDAKLVDESSLLSGVGWQILNVGINTFIINVSNIEKTHSTDYEVTIFRKSPSTNSFLSELSINEIEFTSFDKNQFTYSLNVAWEVLSLTINAKTEDTRAKILQSKNNTYEFKKDLSTGNNQILINIEAEDGTITNYSLIIIRSSIMNNNSSLKELEVEGLESFDLSEQETEIKIFNIILPYSKESIKIKAIPTVNKSIVVGATTYVLNTGLNQIDITCFAENKAYYTIYRIFVFREVLSNNNLIEDVDIEEKSDFVFDKHVESYHITFKNKTKSLNLNIELADKSAIYKVVGNENFNEGINVVEIRVTAVDESVRTYTFFVNIMVKENSKGWIYGTISLGVINTGLVVLAFIQRKKIRL